MRRRLDLASALVHEPEVLFLDEPTTGLDPVSRKAIWEEVAKLNDEGTTVFLTTQYLEEADQLADRVGIIDAGRIVAEDTPEALKAEIGNPHLELGLAEGASSRPSEIVARSASCCRARTARVLVEVAEGAAAVARVVRALDEAGIVVESLDLVEPTLDDVFVAKTGLPPGGGRRRRSGRGGRGSRRRDQRLADERAGGRRARAALGAPDLPPAAADGADHRLPDAAAGDPDRRRRAARSTCRASPRSNGFLDFMLAGAMIQSTLLAGNSGGIALAVDIEMGFTDRLLAAPISRFAMVLGRLAGTAVLGAAAAFWFIAIGLIFGASISEGVAGCGGDRDLRRASPRSRSGGSAPRSRFAPAAPRSSRGCSRWCS